MKCGALAVRERLILNIATRADPEGMDWVASHPSLGSLSLKLRKGTIPHY